MKKLYIETYGCQMNVADSEVVASVMKMAGYETTDSLDEADAVFLNTCSVRENAENKIYKRLEALAAVKRKRKSQPQTHLQPHPKGGGSDASSPKGEAEGGISTHGAANGGNLIIGVLGCMAERVKDDLLENHHCGARTESHQHRTVDHGDLSRHRSDASPRSAHRRLREHNARMQQLLPLLHSALHPWT